jgi:DNA (cytosine-5)-methyltransferase 1
VLSAGSAATFAGGGGSSTGYRLAGGKILAINEFVHEARETYAANYPHTPIIPDDIKKLSGADILAVAGVAVGELDLLDGSPPCSAFSIAGRGFTHNAGSHKSGYGKKKHYSDEQEVENIEDLFFEFLRVAKDIQPKVIIGENVKGLTIGEAKEYYHRIINEFDNIGYDVCSKVLNAKHFGVAQSRARTIFIALRRDITAKVGKSFMNIHSVFPTESNEIIPLAEAMVDLHLDEDEVAMLTEKWVNTAFHKKTGYKFPQNPDKVISGENVGRKNLHFSCKKTSALVPAPTITAMGSAETTAGAFHWIEPRKLTLGELKRIMSLPDDFKLTGKWNQKAERCGRMVPPLMMEKVATSIYEKVLEKYNG